MRRPFVLASVMMLLAVACGDGATTTTQAAADGGTTTTSASGSIETTIPTPAGTETGQPPTETTTTSESDLAFPAVIDVKVTTGADGTYKFDVTISSPYDSSDRYADAWRVMGLDGTVYGIRDLLHDHAAEQPFTRSLDGVQIPPEVTKVVVEGRDLVNGWGGETMEVNLPYS